MTDINLSGLIERLRAAMKYQPHHALVGMVGCPNCARAFYPMGVSRGQYCPECWSAWCRADGSFEQIKLALQSAEVSNV